MARRTTSHHRRIGARRRTRQDTAERWLLLIGIVGFVVIGVGVIGPRPFATTPPNLPEPLTMAEARASNAAVPIVRRRRVPAARFHLHGGPAERAQAVECLATAALYEVGDDRAGQRAVIQVILNRARAPGFPRTICGIVYQGSARTTGCQFSFTCDGSIARRPIHSGWRAARTAARRALSGYVDADIGRATHYHADWVVPFWRDTMVKIARVGPHLFYVRA